MPSSCDSTTLDRQAQHIAQKASLYDLVGRMIAVRGVSPQSVGHFLDPKLKNLLPNPSSLKDMDKAAGRIAKAIINHEKIAIFGDYDVDGGCSSAILKQFFNSLDNQPITYIPDRFKEGYGPNTKALQSLIDQDVTLIICVDCGAASHTVFDETNQKNTDIIVLDHHKCENAPNIFATVNPNRLDCASGLGYLCAGGVSFITAIAVTRALQQQKYFENHPKPDLLQLLDLVALSTICDVMPLTGLNRALVTQGLKILAKRERIGLAALLEVSGVQKTPDAFSCGFALGPRINAGGRISESDLGLKLLSCSNPIEAHQLAERLDTINKQRQNVEQGMLQQATDLAIEQHEKGAPVILLHHADWHPGIVGIVAGRIKEQLNRPTLIGAELVVIPAIPVDPPAPSKFPGFNIPSDANLPAPFKPSALPLEAPKGELVTFPIDSDTPNIGQNGLINSIAWMRQGRTIYVHGYGDANSISPESQSQALSLALLRAKTVAKMLIAHNVPESSIAIRAHAIGHGVRIRMDE